jgi:2-polyprenyl-3-methyl-5-hydroxy-6-metoxy-1,4-benzoquinol methylase
MILDHGCSGGLISLYLAAIGYSGVHGVNVNNEVENLNKIFETLGYKQQKKFFRINGRELPFSDDTFDFIFSKQVLEHVNAADIEICTQRRTGWAKMAP